jgi:tetratricopeptide (TPR) repeat protein
MNKRSGAILVRKTIVHLGVFILALTAASAALAQEQRWNELNQKANNLFNQGDETGATAAAEEALRVAESTFPADHPNVGISLNNLGVIYQQQKRYPEAESMLKRGLAIKEKLYGAEDPRLITPVNNLANLAEVQHKYDEDALLRKRALEIGEKNEGKEGVDLPSLLENLAALYYFQNRFNDAEPLFQRCLSLREKELGAESPDLVPSLRHLVKAYKREQKLSAAEPLSTRILAIDEKASGKDSPVVAEDLDELGHLYQDDKRYTEAEPLLVRVLQIRQRSTVADQSDVLDAKVSLAGLYLAEGKNQEAETLYKDVSQAFEKTPDSDDATFATALDGLASLAERKGDSGEGVELRERAQQIRWRSMNATIQQLGSEGRYLEAAPVAEEALQLAEKTFGPDDLNVSRSLNNLSVVYRALGKTPETEPLLLRASQIAEKNLSPDSLTLAKVIENLATSYFDDGKFAAAEPLFQRVLNIREKALPPGDPSVASSLGSLGSTYFKEGRYQEAEPVFRRLLALNEKVAGADSPDLVPLLETLATSCQKQGKLDESEAILARVRRIKGAPSQTSEGTKNDSAALFDAASYLHLLAPAASKAANIIANQGNPIIVAGKPIALQVLTTSQPVSLTVLFPTAADFPQYLPILKSSAHSFCQVIPPVAPSDTHNLVICDPDTLRQLDILIRAAYSPSYLDQQMTNDWTFMRFLARLQTEPAKVIEEVKSTVSDEQVEEDMSLLLAFLLAHETWHLTHGKGTQFDSGVSQEAPSDTELNEKLMCRNYQAFLRNGFKLSEGDITWPVALSDEGTTDEPSFRQTFKITRDIWQEEEDADRFAAETLEKYVYSLHKNGHEDEVYRVSSRVLQGFALMMLDTWYSKIAPFATAHCGAFANQDFYLMRCTCQNKSIYRDVVNLFGSTHPPIVLRMYTAAASYLSSLKTNVGIDLTTSQNPMAGSALYWLALINGLSDVPLKLSWVQCSDFKKVRDQVEQSIGQEVPDLARFRMSRLNRKNPGYPTEDEEILLTASCLTTGNDAPVSEKKKKTN